MRLALGQIRTRFTGFQRLAELARDLDAEDCAEYNLDMSNVTWLDANMCAPLGGVLRRCRDKGASVSQSGLAGSPRTIMRKNHFLKLFNVDPLADTYDTTIKFRRFEADRSGFEEFQAYVLEHFKQGSRGLPTMTAALLRRFRESLFEVFENAVEHSYTRHGVFACGQHFPKKARLDFTIADMGIGIRENIRRSLGVELPPIHALDWAVSGNTTRRGRPGGLGLQLIKEFVALNGGRLIVVSDLGFWQLSQGSSLYSRELPCHFPGTAVTIEVRTSDTRSYCLSSELDPNSIF